MLQLGAWTSQQNKVAVLGTFRSGSSMVAAMLNRLGVDMGAPYHGDYYEPADLAVSLRRWWNEPELTAQETTSNRVFGEPPMAGRMETREVIFGLDFQQIQGGQQIGKLSGMSRQNAR